LLAALLRKHGMFCRVRDVATMVGLLTTPARMCDQLEQHHQQYLKGFSCYFCSCYADCSQQQHNNNQSEPLAGWQAANLNSAAEDGPWKHNSIYQPWTAMSLSASCYHSASIQHSGTGVQQARHWRQQ
jgi:hypothetical protein